MNCIECGMEMSFEMTNYGTPEYPCCIHCYNDAQSFKQWVITGEAKTPAIKAWVNYLKS